MATVYPISGAPRTSTTPAPNSNELSQDTFLKLLVAQMKYQDPLSPVDSTQFLTQTAQFTTLETLQKMEQEQAMQAQSAMVLSATSMVGRSVTYSMAAGGQAVAPTPTTIVSLRGTLPKDADVGTRSVVHTAFFDNEGKAIPIDLEFAKTDKGWTVQAKSNGRALGDPQALTFDKSGDRTGGDINIPSSALEGIVGTGGKWPPTGVTLTFGDPNDPTRLQLGSGPGTITAIEQNGNDGNTATGVVTGIHLTADGPMLIIGGREVPLGWVLGVVS